METQLSMFYEKEGKWEKVLDIFHDTIGLSETELKVQQKRAGSQNALILQLFKSNPDKLFTPCDVHRELGEGKWNTPLTSIRRSLTDLTKAGHLVKTSEMRIGWYGMKNHMWRLA